MDIKSDENAEYYNHNEKLYNQLTQTSEGNTSTNSILDDQLTQTSEGNVSTNSSKNTKKLSPLWLYFSFKPSLPDIPICDKCGQKFLPKSGNSSLEKHLNSQYNIIIPKIKCYQSKLPFVRDNPWPKVQKKEHDLALIT
ncbi:zinc finger bed domain-containing protein ricesleeper 2-like [Gigaspora margarita]|uniref:Zinc finger bed domain-containing protein ricesleeper 2-like n=1 Tax=Gigaspora margarita TaxID=4874 RepID=A0A8H3X776_GIGMA|nr:zinc finger bed domain-containing protein ricesleeper 2-like [Gigaspora margarita]